MREMHPDLMHAPGFGKTTDKGKFSFSPFETLFDFEPRYAFPTRWVNGLPEPDVRFAHCARPANRGIATPCVFHRPAVDDRPVNFLRLTPFEHTAEFPGGLAVFRDQHHAAGFAIQSRDDGERGAVFHFVGKQDLDAAEQVRFHLAVRRMHDQRRGLVHDDPIVAFPQHPEIRHRA